jgi:predicted Fe-S protein YdhL (DUF1289 family)
MKDLRSAPAAALEPASPCVKVCALDQRGYCHGCERHIDEIVAWPRMSAEAKTGLLDELPERRRRRAEQGA